MKREIYSLLLTALLGMTGMIGFTGQVWAQDVPEPTAQWNFNNADDLMAPNKGSLKMIPAVTNSNFIEVSTLSDADITQTDGPTNDNPAIMVPATSALKVERAEGAQGSESYTIVMDMKVLDAVNYNGLFQTSETNSDDGDLFIYKHQIGMSAMGGYFGKIRNNIWYRVAMSNSDGQVKVYVNGDLLITTASQDRWKIGPWGFYLFCDEDGEKVDTYVSGVTFWETALTDEQVSALGGIEQPEIVPVEIASAEDLIAFADFVNEGNDDAYAVLTADITLTEPWETPIGIDGAPFAGNFDGQGHTISGLQGTSQGKFGLFGYIRTATVKNFSINGTISAEAAHGTGAIGWSETSSISNVHSSLVIDVPVGDVHHVGGVVGSAQYHNRITGCTFDGSMTVAPGNSDNFAGIAGYMAEDTLVYCANYGTITFADQGCSAGGITGYLNNTGGVLIGCLNTGAVSWDEVEGTPTNGGAIIGRLNSNYTIANIQHNYYLQGSANTAFGSKTLPETSATTFTEDKIASGELCYMLNGDQTSIGWYQTIGTDDAPVLDSTHGQVYMMGRLHCNGDAYEDSFFTNDYSTAEQDDHNIVDGFCDYCGLFDETYLTPNADGFFEIANAKQLIWFENYVNKGNLEANAILTDDIDFADLMSEEDDPDETEIEWTPIGDWGATRGFSSAGFKGHFDGQGHTIKHLNATSKQNYFGLFGVISTDCLIENFDIYGEYNTKYQYAGSVAAYARDDRPTIRNVHSFVNIHNSYAGGRQGGILGGVLTTTYKTTVENCTYSGTLDGNDAGGSGNYGGIIGYVNNNGATVADITNCLFDGQVINTNSAPGTCTFGGFVGYSNGGVVTIKNGLSIGTVESTVWGMFFGAVKSTKSSLPNCYYMGDIINGSASTVTLTATETNTSELASGEICWKLNGESFIDVVWHQVLDEQNYPVPYGDEGVIYQTNNGDYKCISNDPESLADFINDIVTNETEFLEDLIAYQVLIDAYKAEVESWEEIETLEEFFEAYQAAAGLKESVQVSAGNYAAYMQTCADAARYIEENSLQGETTDILNTYLEDDVEPSETTYPNGSYVYILDNLNLDDEAILAEIEFVNQMLEAAVAADGIMPGNEISRLFTNTSFAAAFEGWTTENDGIAFSNGGTTDVMPIVRGLGNGTFSVSQTKDNLPNGIYMMTTNAMFRAGSDVYSKFYAGQVFMNSNVNYVMTPGEDVLPEDEAEEGVNYLSSDILYEGEVTGYVPNGMTGCSYAFNSGRYENFCATTVTDGTLTIGVRSLGTGLDSDWLPFSNMHIFYLGTAEEADEALTEVLEGYVDRAQVILDFEHSLDDTDFAQYPNISEELRGQLEEAVLAAEDPEDKMALINTFSDLFNQIHACRRAYIAMLDAAYKLYELLDGLDAAGLVSPDDYDYWDAEWQGAQGYFDEGSVTTEEALAIADKLSNANLISLDIVDDVYQLATAEDVRVFAALVNCGFNTVKAVLTDDIDMSDIIDEGFEPIGSASTPFQGEFDGQNHKITNFGQYIQEEGEENGYYTLNFSGGKQGFFGYIKNATLKNFSIDGAFDYDSGNGYGAIGWAEGSTFINIHSSLKIGSAAVTSHIGGICGSLREGSKAYNCSFSGTITDTHGSHDCLGGIGGYSNENCRYENCANYGTISFTASNAYAGGICGYVNNDSFVGIFNCLNVGNDKLASGGTPTYSGAIVGRLRSHANSKFENNYWLTGSAARAYGENSAAATAVTAAQLASGEICYKLNGDQSEINWFQTLPNAADATIVADPYPVLFGDHLVVWPSAFGGYTNNEADDIHDIKVAESAENGAIFNLAGQRLQKMQKGINIVNGKKILVK